MITIDTIQDCKKGRRKGQQKLFDFFAGQMFNVCNRYMNNREEAEDMLSQGFTKVFKFMPDFEYRDLNSLRAWIKRIMVNECLMGLRKSVNFSLVSLSDHEEISYADHNLGKIEAEYIVRALNELPIGYKTILNLFAIEGYSHKEIAAMLGINEGTSRSQLNKARKMMKEKLDIESNQYGKRKV
ncbi:RNA polymerase sigma factor [Pedobacter metabolipauper]|uniref:RNA polymerase sigma factor n=1 Tax=Pedobacter metabolipauper TaxID=425513 RepID=UPI0014150DCC|nr:sigma-70 family RNA polymerase sigma factor [Pedobacter metabolipauper]